MTAYRATFDVPRETVQFTAQLLAAERRRRGTRGEVTSVLSARAPDLRRPWNGRSERGCRT